VIVGYINKAGNITHIYFKIFEKLKCSLLLILTMKLIFLKKKISNLLPTIQIILGLTKSSGSCQNNSHMI